jgi:hypothetical protein
VAAEIGGCEAVAGLCVEEQEAARTATVRNEMAASFMGNLRIIGSG